MTNTKKVCLWDTNVLICVAVDDLIEAAREQGIAIATSEFDRWLENNKADDQDLMEDPNQPPDASEGHHRQSYCYSSSSSSESSG